MAPTALDRSVTCMHTAADRDSIGDQLTGGQQVHGIRPYKDLLTNGLLKTNRQTDREKGEEGEGWREG